MRISSDTSGIGHVLETDAARKIEEQYKQEIVGYTARWKIVNGYYRVEVWDARMGQWRGTYPLSRDDLEIAKSSKINQTIIYEE